MAIKDVEAVEDHDDGLWRQTADMQLWGQCRLSAERAGCGRISNLASLHRSEPIGRRDRPAWLSSRPATADGRQGGCKTQLLELRGPSHGAAGGEVCRERASKGGGMAA